MNTKWEDDTEDNENFIDDMEDDTEDNENFIDDIEDDAENDEVILDTIEDNDDSIPYAGFNNRKTAIQTIMKTTAKNFQMMKTIFLTKKMI